MNNPRRLDATRNGLKCTICGKTYGVDEIDYICPEHGDDGIVDVLYDYDAIGRNISRETLAQNHHRTIWRYKPLMPVAPESAEPPLRVGWTPLYAAPRLAEKLGLRHLWVKDDGVNPTASFKDRASAVAVVKAREAGAEIITTASTGNAAAALAGLSASVGLPAVIFVPKSAPEAKIAQHLIYGARVMLVDGTYDDAFELTLKVAREFGWYNRNTAYNPYMTEGKKTGILEICEQLAWEAPDRVFVPVGDGCIIGSVHKGLKDLMALGWIDHMPKIMGVQAAGSSPLVDAWERGIEGWEMEPVSASSVADSIVAGLPRDRNKAWPPSARPTAPISPSATRRSWTPSPPSRATRASSRSRRPRPLTRAWSRPWIRGWSIPHERIVVMLTGSGLKDIKSAMKTVPAPPIVAPNLDAVKALL